jgi:hypothetical protein
MNQSSKGSKMLKKAMSKIQNPSFISSNKQFYGPPKSYKNAPNPAKAKVPMPKVPVVQADTLQSGGIDNAGEISQGLFKKVKLQGSFKKGGLVKKTGAYKLHKGEKVIPKNKVKKLKKK